jgi:hypothetical protein
MCAWKCLQFNRANCLSCLPLSPTLAPVLSFYKGFRTVVHKAFRAWGYIMLRQRRLLVTYRKILFRWSWTRLRWAFADWRMFRNNLSSSSALVAQKLRSAHDLIAEAMVSTPRRSRARAGLGEGGDEGGHSGRVGASRLHDTPAVGDVSQRFGLLLARALSPPLGEDSQRLGGGVAHMHFSPRTAIVL